MWAGFAPGQLRNDSSTSSGKLPFGGMNASGNGHASALFAVLYYTYPVASLEDDKPFDAGALLPGVNLG